MNVGKIGNFHRVKAAVQRGKVKAVILAGGFGQRLGGIADNNLNINALAKPAVPIGNLRAIDFSIQAFKALDIEEIHVATCYLPETIEAIIKDPIYGVRIFSYLETGKPLDTCGAVKRIADETGWLKEEERDSTIIVLSGDIVHNIELVEVLDKHLEKNAAATMVVHPENWSKMGRFGSIRCKGMALRENFAASDDFERAIERYIDPKRGALTKIEEFREKYPRTLEEFIQKARVDKATENLLKEIRTEKQGNEEEINKEILRFYLALSNLNNSSIYFINAGAFADFAPYITPKEPGENVSGLSDFGRHLFPLLSNDERLIARYLEDAKKLGPGFNEWRPFDQALVNKIQELKDRFYTYIITKTKEEVGKEREIVWYDVGTPLALWQANMDVLDGKLYTWLGEARGTLWYSTAWGWYGNQTVIQGKISKPSRPSGSSSYAPMGSIIGSNCQIRDEGKIDHSVIRDGVVIGENALIVNSIIFPGVVIDSQSEVISSLVLGGRFPPDHANIKRIENAIYYHRPKNGGVIIDKLR